MSESFFIKKLFKTLPETMQKFVVFCLVGGTGFLINLLVAYIFKDFLGFHYFIAFLFGVGASWTFIFFANSLVTFKGHSKDKYLTKFGKFIFIYIALFCLNASMVFTFTSILHIYYLASITLSTAITTFFTFTMTRRKIFN